MSNECSGGKERTQERMAVTAVADKSRLQEEGTNEPAIY